MAIWWSLSTLIHKLPSWFLFRDQSHEKTLCQEEDCLLHWGALKKVPNPSEKRILLPMLLSCKKNWGWRPILDLHWLHIFTQKLKFCMPQIGISNSLPGREHMVHSCQHESVLSHRHSPVPQEVPLQPGPLSIWVPSIWISHSNQSLCKTFFSGGSLAEKT